MGKSCVVVVTPYDMPSYLHHMQMRTECKTAEWVHDLRYVEFFSTCIGAPQKPWTTISSGAVLINVGLKSKID